MERSSGILLHISSLPGDDGIGNLGKSAFQFVDFLAQTKQKIWQILPLGPVGYGNSPYQCYSAFAGNPMFIDVQQLVADRILAKNLLTEQHFKTKTVEFDRVGEWKTALLREAFSGFQKNFDRFKDEYHVFMGHNSWWLDDYALFRALKTKHNETVWNTWEKELVVRDKQILHNAFQELHAEIDFHRFLQFVFFRQWFKLKAYANSKGVRIIGDIPLYVSLDSADVWANQDIFLLDGDSKPTQVGEFRPIISAKQVSCGVIRFLIGKGLPSVILIGGWPGCTLIFVCSIRFGSIISAVWSLFGQYLPKKKLP